MQINRAHIKECKNEEIRKKMVDSKKIKLFQPQSLLGYSGKSGGEIMMINAKQAGIRNKTVTNCFAGICLEKPRNPTTKSI
jgi:hypothetical protein